MANSSISYYIKEYNTANQEINITEMYTCVITKVEGVNDFGEPQNTYIEKFIEETDIKVYIAPKMSRKLVDIKLNIIFIGTNFQKDYEDMVAFVSGKKLIYWDTLRKKRCYIILNKEVKTESEKVTDFLQAEFTFMSFQEPENI